MPKEVCGGRVPTNQSEQWLPCHAPAYVHAALAGKSTLVSALATAAVGDQASTPERGGEAAVVHADDFFRVRLKDASSCVVVPEPIFENTPSK